MDMSLDPREPAPSSVGVTTTIDSHEEDFDSASPFLPIPRSAFITSDTGDNEASAAQSLYPDRPLANASSSRSLTERPARHDRVKSTTITPDDVSKRMEKGTFGSQTLEDLEPDVETHVVCMLREDVEAGLAPTKNWAEDGAQDVTGVETKKLKKHRKIGSLHQIFKENAANQKHQARADGVHEATELSAADVAGDWETGSPVLHCGQCGGQMIVFRDEGDKLMCLDCGILR